jgi:hypothetical protein
MTAPQARRAATVEPFLAVEVFERAQALERAGIDVVHLEFGEPDFDTPPAIVEAATRAIKDGRTRYTASLGILPLREAIAEHYASTYGVEVSPEQILVTPGTSPAMLLLFGHLLDAGDEVVLSDPYYACYPNFIRYAEGQPVYVGVREEDGFQYRAEAIRTAWGRAPGPSSSTPRPTPRARCCFRSTSRRSRTWPGSASSSWCPTRSTTACPMPAATARSSNSPTGPLCSTASPRPSP